jgi:hypothetical protein
LISVADLNALERDPQVAYDGYQALRDEARRRTSGPINPAALDTYRAMLTAHDHDWFRSVLGHDVPPDMLRNVPWLEVEMLQIAHERALQPPKPPWLIQWQAESAATRRLQEEHRDAGLRLDRDRWAAALTTSGLTIEQLEVRPNLNSRKVHHHGHREALNHVVPLVAVRSAKRRHPAGRELCAVTHSRQLGDPTRDPATCVACVRYTAELQPSGTVNPDTVTCVYCGRQGVRGFVVSSGDVTNAAQTTWRCASFQACERRRRQAGT